MDVPGETKVSESAITTTCLSQQDQRFYDNIRRMCIDDALDPDIDLSPQAFRDDRISKWPDINSQGMGDDLSAIYRAVRETGLPNAMGAQLELPTQLHLLEWEKNLSSSKDHRELLSYIRYRLPLGYMGPPSGSVGTPNHSSAMKYPNQIDDFINDEVEMGGVIGPMRDTPFTEWAHMSPLMSREKRDSDKRRVIIDMTFPPATSINAFINKNMVAGVRRDHRLPGIDDLVKIVRRMGPGAFLSSTDVSRAYKNFKSCPLDWPLLGFEWQYHHALRGTILLLPYAEGGGCYC